MNCTMYFHHQHHVPEGLGCFLFLDPQNEVGLRGYTDGDM